MNSAWQYLERLSAQANRGSATRAESVAADRIAGWLRELGYRVETQSFRAPRDTLYLGPTLVIAVVLVGGTLAHYWPPLGLLLTFVALAPLVGELLGSDWCDFDLCLPRYGSQNVVATLPSLGHTERTVIVTAHYDTQRASLLFHPCLARWLGPYFLVVYTALAVMPITMVLRWLETGLPWLVWTQWGAAVILGLTGLFLLMCRMTGRHINGANDNGSGAALTLALATRFARMPLANTELIFVLTGSEEVGTRGMKQFMRSNLLDQRTTCFVNLDNLGSGRLHYLAGEGMLRYYCSAPALVANAKKAADLCQEAIGTHPHLLLPTDGLISSRKGFPTITFVALNGDGFLPDYHWYTDQIDRVDRDLLAFEERYLAIYLHMLMEPNNDSQPL